MPGMTRNEMFTLFESKGVTKIEVSFSGGNDEGGADDIVYLNAAGETIEESKLFGEVARAYETWSMPDSGGAMKSTWAVYNEGFKSRPATPEEIQRAMIMEALEEPIYSQYGSFAGDFYVSGELTWDIAARKGTMASDEAVPRSEHYELDF